MGAGPSATDKAEPWVEPVTAGLGMLAGENFDTVTRLQLMRQRHDTAIDLGALATVTDLGVHLVREVQHRRTQRQVQHLATRRQHIYPVLGGNGPEALQQTLVIEFFLAGFQ